MPKKSAAMPKSAKLSNDAELLLLTKARNVAATDR
jgi:hypothetical protein